ncbi:iron ABC transporter substrate-binding protein, partial [Vibrio fortis]
MKKLLTLSALACATIAPTAAIAAEEVNVYSYRQPFLV